MKRDNWPVEKEGIRPAGPPDECLYCGVKEGGVHGPECVIRERTVIMDVTIRILKLVPECWTEKDIEYHYNESGWCADNILPLLDTQAENRGCLCQDFRARYVREATEQDEQDYGIAVKDCES